MATLLRSLLPDEISMLETRRCTSEDWSLVKVAQDFSTEHVSYAHFSGNIELGSFEGFHDFPGGIRKRAGIHHAALHNCSVGNDCLIENIHNYIANYRIEDHTVIQNVDLLVTEDYSSFGNGVEISVLNETGGREIRICNKLSAHLAYMLALYRHRPGLISRLNDIIRMETERVSSETGRIGRDVIILNSRVIKNVFIGDCCTIEGVERLENGSINSNAIDPVQIGHGVIAHDFIISSGAHITDGVLLTRCFVGQACHLSHHYSAHDSVFFSNCQGENGEACAIFAGPYTVTMHKSSLLIAGMFSFMNAGSGSNQSNHMYKLGPIHQGIVERGSKTTSDSYLLWPARVGAFSLVMGRHVHHSDTSDMPFSYLIEQDGETYLVPGINLSSVGTIRDAQKWPKRDRRKDNEKLDQINFNLLSPYTIQKMLKAVRVLQSLQKTSGEGSNRYFYQSCVIKNSSLIKGLKLYHMAIHKFLGNSLIKRLENIPFRNEEEIRARLLPDSSVGSGEWLDLSGLLVPKSEIEQFIAQVENETLDTVDAINKVFCRLHEKYYDFEWTWAYEVLSAFYEKDLQTITAREIIAIVEQWKDSVVTLDKMLYEDARKEFSLNARTGFGMDGNNDEQKLDFEQVRGAFESNPFVTAVARHIVDKTALGDELIQRLSPLLT